MTQEFTLAPNKGAPLWRRFASMVYDSFLLLALSMGYGGLITLVITLIKGDASAGEYQPMVTSTLGNIALFLGWLTTLMGFYVFFWRKAGQTAGMRAWRLQVISLELDDAIKKPTLKESFLRAPLSILSLMMVGAGYWWHILDKNGDCLHDKFSNTRVIVTPPRKKKR